MSRIQSVIRVNSNTPTLAYGSPYAGIAPNYEFDQTGADLADHNGPAIIELLCPHCSKYNNFIVKSVVIVTDTTEYGTERYFYSIASCSSCNNVVKVDCFDFDDDRDYFFDYATHSPKKETNVENFIMPNVIKELYVEAKTINSKHAALILCIEIIKLILKERDCFDQEKALIDGLSKLELPIPQAILEQYAEKLNFDHLQSSVSHFLVEDILMITGYILENVYPVIEEKPQQI